MVMSLWFQFGTNNQIDQAQKRACSDIKTVGVKMMKFTTKLKIEQ